MASRKELEILDKNLQYTLPSTSCISSAIQDDNISGKIFLELTADELKDLVPSIGDRKEVKRLLDRYQAPSVVSVNSFVCKAIVLEDISSV